VSSTALHAVLEQGETVATAEPRANADRRHGSRAERRDRSIGERASPTPHRNPTSHPRSVDRSAKAHREAFARLLHRR
jgi:hypothetical protein